MDGFGFDIVGSNHAALLNGATYGPATVSKGLVLDGAGDHAAIPASLVLNVGAGNGLTIELWINPSNVANHPLVEWNSNSTSGVHFWIYQTPGQLYGQLKDTSGNGHAIFSAGGIILPNVWQHVALTYDKPSGVARMYLNGVMVSEAALGSFTPQTSYPLYFGLRPEASGPFPGRMDEIAIYDRALESIELALIYAAGSAGKCFTNDPGPVFLVHPQSQTGYLGSAITLVAAAMGVPRPSYQWCLDGLPISGATNATYSIVIAHLNDAGTYTLVASNAFGTVVSSNAVLILELALANRGFETSESTDDDWPATFRNWSGDYSQIWLSPTLGISPRSGFGMLRLINAGPDPGGAGTGWLSCQTLQLIDLAPIRGQLDEGFVVSVAVRGFFNRIAGDAQTDTAFAVSVVACDGLPSAFPTVWAQQAYLRRASYGILTDGDVTTWEEALASMVVPPSATYLAVQISASENIYDDATAPEFDGHFADDISLTVSIRDAVWNNPERFDSGWSDWQTENTSLWQVGVPTAGPPLTNGSRAYSPTNCAATLLSANYSANSLGRLLSPRFIVPSMSGDERVILRWRQYYQYGTGDAGLVQILTPYDTNWTTLAVAATNGTSGNWQIATVDLTPYQGQEVRVGFLHTANGNTSVGAGWFIDDVSLSQSVPTRLALDTVTTNSFTSNRQGQYFVVSVPSGGHLQVTLDALAGLGINELYVRRGALPSPGAYDFRYSVNGGADQSIFVPNAGAGEWFILAFNDSGPVDGGYTLAAVRRTGMVLGRLEPARVGNSVPGSVTIHGAGFTPDTKAELVNGASSFPATESVVVSDSRIVVNFDFTAIPPGNYELQLTAGTDSDALPFVVTGGGQAKLTTRLSVPRRLGRHAPAKLYIEYANAGQVAMPAPLLVLTGTQRPKLRPVITSGTFNHSQGFWNDAEPLGWSSTIQFLASGATPGILQPGESNRITIAYAGLRKPWDFSRTAIRFDLGVLSVTNTTAVDWDSLKPTLKPDSIAQDAWDALWPNFTAQAGATWGDYLRMLIANAVYLRKLGLDVKDLNHLLAFSFAQADGLNVIRTLAASTDAFAPTPGLRLSFERSFPQSISGRFRSGPLGRGWSHNWDIGLSTNSDGTVNIFGPVGSRRIFQPNSQTSGTAFFSEEGDHGVLTKSGGIFTLTEPHGLQRVFVSDGKLSYVQDPNGNRITPSYSGNLITRLTHSAGQSLTLAYNGNLLESVTDNVGRATTFTYNGDHLTSANYFDGSEVRYTYEDNAPTPAMSHALKEIAYPGGAHEFFGHHANGRLASLSRDGGSDALAFNYPGGGLVSVADAFANQTRFFLDHRGLLAKVENPLTNTLRLSYDEKFNLTSITDPAGRSHQYGYDTSGNLIQSRDPLGGRTRFTYGALNRLATLTDAKGNLTRYSHTSNGDLNAITYADNSVERWGYDTIGNPTSWTNRRVQRIQYQFNTNGQLTAKLYPDGSRADYGYDVRGNLTFASNYVGVIALEYYSNDRLRRITYPGNRWLEYEYDDAGRRTSMIDQLGYRLNYLYDTAGRPWQLTNNAGTRLVLYEYDTAGRLWRKTLGNGVYTTNLYDSAGQVLSLHNRKADGTLLSRFDYTYDGRGRRTRMETHYGVWTYEYDDVGQLTHAVLVSTDPNIPNQDLRYIYDPLGNRVRTVENGVITDYVVNRMNQYMQVGTTTLNFDADGSLTQKIGGATTLLSITNSFENRVIGFGSTNGQRRYDYDALGFPSIVSRDGVRRYQIHDPFDLGDLVTSYNEAGVLIETRHHGLGVLQVEGHYLTFDALGNVRDSTSTIGALVATEVFRPFGERFNHISEPLGQIGFVGEFGVAHENDLISMRLRFYDSSIARFTSVDPIGISAGDANLYRYANNNPVMFVDPDGLRWQSKAQKRAFMTRQNINGLPIKIWNNYWFSAARWTLAIGTVAGNIAYDRVYPEHGGSWVGPLGEWPGIGPSIVEYFLDTGPSIKEYFLDTSFLNDFGAMISAPIPSDVDWEQLDSELAVATDPNALTGPAGHGPQNYVTDDGLFGYRIDFENATNATAPAQRVFVTNQLTNLLDWQTFELTEIAFGEVFLAVPPGTRHFEKIVPMRSNGVDFEVQIEAGIRLASGEVYATFRSIVPTTGLPPGVETGFLPPEPPHNPNDDPPVPGQGRGQGHISYVIRANTNNISTGTEIRNVAFIIFDQQPAIRTDQVDPHNPAAGIDTNKQALVTIDADGPVSTVTGPTGTAGSVKFQVCWDGADIGSGIAGYDVYVSTNGTTWTLWLANTATNCATFLGTNSTTYHFYSVAHDNTGQVEPEPTTADVTVITPPNSPPELAAVPKYLMSVNQTLTITNLASDPDVPAQTLRFSLAEAPSGASINDQTGVFRWTPTCGQGNSTNRISVRVTDNGQPVNLSATQTFLVTVRDCVEASLGNTVLLAGATSKVTIRLDSTIELTNLSFHVAYPPERFTNVLVLADTNVVPAVFGTDLSAGDYFISFDLPASRILRGPTNVGELTFSAVLNQSSAFVPLRIENIDGRKPNGGSVANAYGYPGRVVVIGAEPLLEAWLHPNGDVQLMLYGPPGVTVRVEWASQLPAGSGDWNLLTQTNLSALSTLLSPVPANPPMRFFRSVRQ